MGKLGISVLIASTLLAAGFVLYAGQPDDVERLLNATGSPSLQPDDSGPVPSDRIFMSVAVPCQGLSTLGIYRELRDRGWHAILGRRAAEGRQTASLAKGPDDGVVEFNCRPGICQITYARDLTPLERRWRSVKANLHLPH